MATLKVGADGKAPSNAKVGDTIVTAGGNYKITGTKSDGGWASEKVTTPTVATVKPTVATTKPTNTVDTQAQDYINRMKEAQIQSQVAQLNAKKNTNLANLDSEKATVAPMYQNQRQTTNAQSQLGKKTLAEYMANRGATNSGGAVGLEAKRENALLGNINSINNAETAKFADIEARRTGINNAYETDLVSAKAGIEGQAMQNQLNMYNQQQAQARNDTINTMGAYSNDYMAQIQAIQNDGDSSNDWQIPYLQSLRNEKIQTQEVNAQKQAQAQQNAEVEAQQVAYDRAFDLYKSTGFATPEISQLLGVPQGYNAEALADIEYKKAMTNNLNKPKTTGTTSTNRSATQTQIATAYNNAVADYLQGAPRIYNPDTEKYENSPDVLAKADIYAKNRMKTLYGIDMGGTQTTKPIDFGKIGGDILKASIPFNLGNMFSNTQTTPTQTNTYANIGWVK